MRGKGHGPGQSVGMGPKKLPRNIGTITRRLLHYLNESKSEAVLAFFCVIPNTAATLAGPYTLRPVINTLIALLTGGPGGPAGFARALTVLAAVFAVGVFANYTQIKIMLTMAQDALQKIRNDLFVRVRESPIRFYDINSSGDLMNRFTNDVDTTGQMLSSTLVQLLSGALNIIDTLFLMLYTNLILILVTLVIILVMMKVGGAVAGWGQKYFTTQRASLGVVNGYIEETITGQKVIEMFCHEDEAGKEFGILNHDLEYSQIRARFFGSITGPVMSGLNQINYSLTVCVGGLLCVLRGFDMEGLTVLLNFSRRFGRLISEISMQVSNVFSALAGAECVFSVMDEEPELVDIMGRVVPNPMVDHAMFHHVAFGYDPDKTILKDINPYAKLGQKITFVGSIGARKTATTNLLNRFYDIRSGTITIDGADIRRIFRDALRNNVATVLQDTRLLMDTVWENIRYGRLDAMGDEAAQTVKTVSAHSFITRLPHGCGIVLGGDGANLSQGQRQLLSAAGAAISKAPMLVPDGATSSVDTKTEKYIEHGMDRLTTDRTISIIAHQLFTIRSANAIVVLEHGEIIERGTHKEPLEVKERYYELCIGVKELD